jgi:hypothetical protein
MVGSLMKLGLPGTASLDNRRLALDIVALVLSWERQFRAAPGPAQAGRPGPLMRMLALQHGTPPAPLRARG